METVYVLQHVEDKSFYYTIKTFGYSLAFAKMYNYKIWAQNALNRMDSRLSNKLIIREVQIKLV